MAVIFYIILILHGLGNLYHGVFVESTLSDFCVFDGFQNHPVSVSGDLEFHTISPGGETWKLSLYTLVPIKSDITGFLVVFTKFVFFLPLLSHSTHCVSRGNPDHFVPACVILDWKTHRIPRQHVESQKKQEIQNHSFSRVIIPDGGWCVSHLLKTKTRVFFQ